MKDTMYLIVEELSNLNTKELDKVYKFLLKLKGGENKMKDMISLIEIYTMARNTKWYEFENYIGKHFLGISETVVKPTIYVNISTEQRELKEE